MKPTILPCDEPCPKCGSSDILRRFLERGADVPYEGYDKCRSKYATGQCHCWRATRDHIHQHCRCCQFSWQTLPLKKSRVMEIAK